VGLKQNVYMIANGIQSTTLKGVSTSYMFNNANSCPPLVLFHAPQAHSKMKDPRANKSRSDLIRSDTDTAPSLTSDPPCPRGCGEHEVVESYVQVCSRFNCFTQIIIINYSPVSESLLRFAARYYCDLS
jgi:hypothetical protein